MKKYYLQVYRHTLSASDVENDWVEVNELQIHPDLIQQLAEFGVVEIKQGCLPAYQIARVQKLIRLRGSLGVDLHGAAIILDLLDRLEELQDEIERLKKSL